MLYPKLSFLQGFPCKLALSSVCSILEHGCPQNDPSPIPLSELNWNRAGFYQAPGEPGCSEGWKAPELFPMWPGVKIAAVFRWAGLIHHPAPWGPCNSWHLKAKQFPVCLSLVCNLIRHQAKFTNHCNPKRNSCNFSEIWGLGRARIPGHVCFYIPVVLFSPQTAIRACPPCIMHAQLHLHFFLGLPLPR